MTDREVHANRFGQPIGAGLGDWTPPPFPPPVVLTGTGVTLEPLDPERHTAPLYAAYRDAPDSVWTYLSAGPLTAEADLREIFDGLMAQPDTRPYAVVIDGTPLGHFEYLRIAPQAGSIEIGWILFSPSLQRTRAATEAVYLMVTQAFDLGYRRMEWKCDDLNAPSRAAAKRFGFTYEGTFRNATHYKGRSRDTSWFSITVEEWPAIRTRFEAWLDDSNFDAQGHQVNRLRGSG